MKRSKCAIWFFNWAEPGHADKDRAVHFHRSDFRVSGKLEGSVRKLEKIFVFEILSDRVVVYHWIGAAVFEDGERVASVGNVAVVHNEGDVFNRNRGGEAKEDSFADNLFVGSFVGEVTVREESRFELELAVAGCSDFLGFVCVGEVGRGDIVDC